MTIDELVRKCKCGVSISINDHLNIYQPIEEALAELEDAVSDESRARIYKTGRLVILRFYPYTPIGFWIIADGTIEDALQRAEACFL